MSAVHVAAVVVLPFKTKEKSETEKKVHVVGPVLQAQMFTELRTRWCIRDSNEV